MNKKIIALAAAGAVLAPFAAQAEVDVYGKVHINAGTYDEEVGGVTQEDNFQINSYDSRFGVKGSHDLNNGLAATYQLEWGINPDDDDTKALEVSNRNQYIGLKGGFGEFRIGTHDTPLKMVQGKFDQFGDTLADFKNAGDQDGESRLANMLLYLGKTSNVGYAIALVPSEGDGTTSGDGVADTVSASLYYANGPFYVGIAADSYDDTGAAANTSNSLTRLVGTYSFGSSQIGLLWQSGVEKVTSSTAEEDWIGVSFNTKMGSDYKFKVQYVMVEDNQSTATDNSLVGVGVERKFGDSASGYVMYSKFDKDAANNADDEEISSFSLGYVVSF